MIRLHRIKNRPLAWVLALLILVILVLGILLGMRSCSSEGGITLLPEFHRIDRLESIVLRPDKRMYGLPADDYEIQTGEIGAGETFSKLLNQRFGVNISVVNQLTKKCEGVFNLRDIRAGNSYTALLTPDSLQLCYLIYERNRTDYLTFCVRDSVYVKKWSKEVLTEERFADASIESSLWTTMIKNNFNTELALRLADIYKSTVDLHELQPGDRFRVVYEESFVDTLSVGIGKIHGAELIHNGKSYWAFRFQQGDDIGYWDDKGVNLKKSVLISPLSFKARLTSKFGVRVHPIRRVRRQHNGVDYACPIGTPVHAVADGVVTRKYWDVAGGGNTIWVKHAGGLETGYLHLKSYPPGIRVGSRVRQEQTIAYSGNTGGSTGPHLDYRVKKNGKYINPLSIPSTPSAPISPKYKPAFEQMKADVAEVFDTYKRN